MARSQSTANGSSDAPRSEDLVAQIEVLKSDIGAITDMLGDMAKAQGNDLSVAAKKRLEAAKARGAEHASEINARASELGTQAGDFVRKQPAMALGLAAGLGFLVGLMTSGRR